VHDIVLTFVFAQRVFYTLNLPLHAAFNQLVPMVGPNRQAAQRQPLPESLPPLVLVRTAVNCDVVLADLGNRKQGTVIGLSNCVNAAYWPLNQSTVNKQLYITSLCELNLAYVMTIVIPCTKDNGASRILSDRVRLCVHPVSLVLEA
jgi:hypothetical protein